MKEVDEMHPACIKNIYIYILSLHSLFGINAKKDQDNY